VGDGELTLSFFFFVLQDMFVIATSSCARRFPTFGGYRHLNSGGISSRNRDPDAENRLIDQLDEDWDD
jgi:cation-dependent mannose-6-phosphate receptor